jgi:hypothetical protein
LWRRLVSRQHAAAAAWPREAGMMGRRPAASHVAAGWDSAAAAPAARAGLIAARVLGQGRRSAQEAAATR